MLIGRPEQSFPPGGKERRMVLDPPGFSSLLSQPRTLKRIAGRHKRHYGSRARRVSLADDDRTAGRPTRRAFAEEPTSLNHLGAPNPRDRLVRLAREVFSMSNTHWIPLGDMRAGVLAVAISATVSLSLIVLLSSWIAWLLYRYYSQTPAERIEHETRAIRFLASSHGVLFLSLITGCASFFRA